MSNNRNNKVRINQGRIVPWQFRLVGTAITLMLIFAALTGLAEVFAIPAAIVLSFLLPLLWSSYYILEIDPVAKTVTEIIWMMGIKKGTPLPFDSIEKIFINPVRVNQRVSSYSGHVHEFKSREYVAFLKLDTGQKFEMTGDKELENLQKKLEPIAEKLQCPIITNP